MGKALLHYVVAALLFLFNCQSGAEEACEYGSLPGTAFSNSTTSFAWKLYSKECGIRNLLPEYTGGLEEEESAGKSTAGNGASMLFIGDSVDRYTLWDVNETALKANWPNYTSILREHWRGALKSPNLEMVYQFAPGSHPHGPYHDDVAYEFSIVNAIPRGFDLHRLLTGRQNPNVVVYSNILWDLGRWLFLSEIAQADETDYYGMPLLRDLEFIPEELLAEWYNDTNLAMQRIERYAGKDAVLIYHNAAYPKLRDFEKDGTMHWQTGTGRRTHIAQMNALARQIVRERPRWHLVDFGMMSEAFIAGSYLRDPHHPDQDFILQAVDIYLNLHSAFGGPLPPKLHTVGELEMWDKEYETHGERHREMYLQEYEEDKVRWDAYQSAIHAPPAKTIAHRFFSRHRMLANLRG